MDMEGVGELYILIILFMIDVVGVYQSVWFLEWKGVRCLN